MQKNQKIKKFGVYIVFVFFPLISEIKNSNETSSLFSTDSINKTLNNTNISSSVKSILNLNDTQANISSYQRSNSSNSSNSSYPIA